MKRRNLKGAGISCFIVLLILANFAPCVFALDYLPKYKDSVKNFGIGVYFAPVKAVLYSEPDETSKVVDVISWDEDGVQSLNDARSVNNVFLIFKPADKVALFAVDEEIDGWCRVFYDQANSKSAWIKEDESKFQEWFGFMNTEGRKKGLYFWADLPETGRQLRVEPDDNAKLTDGCYYANFVSPTIIRGNWMLVRMVDYDRSVRIGWLRWRTDDGRLLVFPRATARD